MAWDFKDQLQASARQVVNNGAAPETTYYVYDASRQRVRKVTEGQEAVEGTSAKKNERIYVGGFEVFREYNGNSERQVELERETLHVTDDQQRIALVETKTVDAGVVVAEPESVIRFQLNNHLGSSSVELDENTCVISYEEYSPYGSTSYQAMGNCVQVSAKRYRYTGMERDEETGLNYHRARFFANWLARWASCDPLGIANDLNGFRYSKCNPINYVDTLGTKEFHLGRATHLLEQGHEPNFENINWSNPEQLQEYGIREVKTSEQRMSSKSKQFSNQTYWNSHFTEAEIETLAEHLSGFERGAMNPEHGSFTSYEIYRILKDPELLRRTNFVEEGYEYGQGEIPEWLRELATNEGIEVSGAEFTAFQEPSHELTTENYPAETPEVPMLEGFPSEPPTELTEGPSQAQAPPSVNDILLELEAAARAAAARGREIIRRIQMEGLVTAAEVYLFLSPAEPEPYIYWNLSGPPRSCVDGCSDFEQMMHSMPTVAPVTATPAPLGNPTPSPGVVPVRAPIFVRIPLVTVP